MTVWFIAMKCAPPFVSGFNFPCSADEEYGYFLDACRYAAIDAAGRGVDLWIDQTTLSNGSAHKLLKGLNSTFNMIIFEQVCTPLAVCLERNAKRTGFECVPEETMLSMAKSYRCRAPTGIHPRYAARHTINDLY